MWNDDVMFENEFLSERMKKNYFFCVSAHKKNIDGLMI
jgi:YHS domain-containing protein